jgi:predicted  nucleic acid-binding Zn-ribbon protein
MAVPSELPPLALLESVRCLECGEVYSKPAAGGTVLKNPGCPECTYVGWIPVSLPSRPEAQPRSAEGRRPLRFLPAR